MSRMNTFFLPRIKPMEYMTVRNAVFLGNLTSRNGTAEKLIFSIIHITAETNARNTAFAARKASSAYSFPFRSIYARVPKKIAGTSARSPMTLVQSIAEMLRLNVHFLSSIREKAMCRKSFRSAVIL